MPWPPGNRPVTERVWRSSGTGVRRSGWVQRRARVVNSPIDALRRVLNTARRASPPFVASRTHRARPQVPTILPADSAQAFCGPSRALLHPDSGAVPCPVLEGRSQVVIATTRANASDGVSQARVCRGRALSSAATASRCRGAWRPSGDRVPHVERLGDNDVWMIAGRPVGAPGAYSMAGFDGTIPSRPATR